MTDMQNTISLIAAFIAARLRYDNPPLNGLNRWVSTIEVIQHKAKFLRVRVYCNLASPRLVEMKWLEGGNAGEPSAEYIASCLLNDSVQYRRVYVDMCQLMPRYRDRICDVAHHPELVHRNYSQLVEQIDLWHAACNPIIDHLLKKYAVNDVQSLKQVMGSVYERSIV